MRQRTGGIDQDPRNGRFRVRVMVRGKRMTSHHATLEEAELARAALLDVSADEYGEGETLLDYGNKILDRREIGREVRDPDSDRGRWTNHIASAPIARISLPHMKRRHAIAWLREMQKKGLARQSVVNTLNVLRVVIRCAVDEELLKANPLDGLRVPAEKRTEDAWTFLTVAQQAALVEAIPNPERHIVKFAIWTGLRAGELASLRLEDVGDEAITVRFGTPPSLPTKRGKIRRVPILPGAREALDAWLPQVARYTSTRREPNGFNPHGVLFPRRYGDFRDPDHILRWPVWDGARKAIGWGGCWHDLRHTCAASLVRGWWGRRWSLEEVCQMLGHASLTTTERYAQLADDILGEAARQTAIGRQLVLAASAELEKKRMKSPGAPETTRTSDQRFRKPLESSGISRNASACDHLATRLLRAVAEGDARALSMAVDLAVAVLEEGAESLEREGVAHVV